MRFPNIAEPALSETQRHPANGGGPREGGRKMHELVGIDVDRLETIEAAAHLLKSTKEDGKERGQVRLLMVDRAIRLHAPTKQCAEAKIQYSLHELTGPGCLRPERK